MASTTGLMVGVKIKEIATRDHSYTNCTVLHSDAIGLVFEVHRNVTEGGNVESVVSPIFVPWVNITCVLLVEERTGSALGRLSPPGRSRRRPRRLAGGRSRRA